MRSSNPVSTEPVANASYGDTPDAVRRVIETSEQEVALIEAICRGDGLFAEFQPILDFRTARLSGYEGLVRGPVGTALARPLALFAAAKRLGRAHEVELQCRRTVLSAFARLGLPGRLFLNISPVEAVGHEPALALMQTLDFLHQIELTPDRIVLELTEHQPTLDLPETRATLQDYRALGFEIALDDLGEGYASLRLWSELRPDYVKIDQHFIDGIDTDSLKLQFVRSIRQIADTSGTRVIAEGIEQAAQFQVVRDLGIFFGQGYFIARPTALPDPELAPAVRVALSQRGAHMHPQPSRLGEGFALGNGAGTVAQLARYVLPVSPDELSEDVMARFERDSALEALPVVAGETPVGLISRSALLGRFARRFTRELYGRKPCSTLMENMPLVVEQNTRIEELSRLIADGTAHHLIGGFVVTEGDRYVGVVQGHALLRQITDMQLDAARYANPLTLLPGNVPIDDYIDYLLASRTPFQACYCDLDNFKPFNDVFGYRRGDDLIQALARVLMAVRNPACDFLGHIGGDDFLLLFQSPDWESRCRAALERFEEVVGDFFGPDQIRAGGFEAEDRRGQVMLYPLTSLSIGAVVVEQDSYLSHVDVSVAAAEAKKMAKRQSGNSLFIERRRARRNT